MSLSGRHLIQGLTQYRCVRFGFLRSSFFFLLSCRTWARAARTSVKDSIIYGQAKYGLARVSQEAARGAVNSLVFVAEPLGGAVDTSSC